MISYEEIAKWSDIISALLFLAVLVWLWFRYIQPAVLAAQERSNELIKVAERHRDEAKAAIDLLHHGIEGAQHDAASIRERVQGRAQREADAMVAETKATGERALRNAQGELERARVAARQELRDEFAERALDLARSQAQAHVDGALNGKLIAAFMASLDRKSAN
ncbi:MAG TPA: hypothetical protein VF741_02410 [Candidatus Aquilonibacter sp.]